MTTTQIVGVLVVFSCLFYYYYSYKTPTLLEYPTVYGTNCTKIITLQQPLQPTKPMTQMEYMMKYYEGPKQQYCPKDIAPIVLNAVKSDGLPDLPPIEFLWPNGPENRQAMQDWFRTRES